MEIRAAEISAILKNEIANFGTEADVAEVGQVISVGDGVARVFGLDEVQAGEMVEFADGSKGMALNLETDNVGVVIFGDDRNILKAIRSSGPVKLLTCPWAKACLAASLMVSVTRSTAKARLKAMSAAWLKSKPPALSRASPLMSRCRPALRRSMRLVPVGRGQRELIIGDRQTGKTAVALTHHQPEAGKCRR